LTRGVNGYPSRKLKALRKIKVYILGFVGFAAIIIAWQALSLTISSVAFPLLPEFSRNFIRDLVYCPQLGSGLSIHLLFTTLKAIIGISLGSIIGVGYGLLMGWSKNIRERGEPPLIILRTTPPLATVPFFLMWFGPGNISQILVIIIYSFLMFSTYTLNAIRNVYPIYGQFAATLGANKKDVFYRVILPSIVPELIGGLRVTLTFSWGLTVIAELMGSKIGMGKAFLVFMQTTYTTGILGGTIWIMIVAFLADRFLLWIAKYITRWMPEGY